MSAHISIDDRVTIICPACDEQIPVPIEVELEEDDQGMSIVATPDTADLWAHMWTHGIRPNTEPEEL